jgi:ABC-2 type transport system ATP-binding protein
VNEPTTPNEPTPPPLIQARGLSKRYGSLAALDRVDFTVQPGRIVGLIGPNGAGKTTALRALLGLTSYQGELSVLGKNPFKDRASLMNDMSFIADVAVLPAWLRVQQAIDFVAGVHPRFRSDRALALLAKTDIGGKRRIGELSKGMKTMLHLALTMAIDARLLVLDEPTLGLDILARRGFYDALVNDYMDETRTILITTHQVEEIENLLTDVLFIDKGRIVLDCSVESIAERYAAVAVAESDLAAARSEHPFYERRTLGKTFLYFEGQDPGKLGRFGEIVTPTVADLFVAKLSSERGA